MGSNNRKSYRGRWSSFPDNYCEKEMTCIAEMISRQHSGAVVGGSGTGKSNLGGVLATRPEMIHPLLPEGEYLFCLVDINSFPQKNSIGFYRGMLHALYKAAKRQNLPVVKDLYQLEQKPLQWNDEQSWMYALERGHELVIDEAEKHLVWLLDRFDKACPTLEYSVLDTLRSLRDDDSFYGRLFYLTFTRKPLQRLREWKDNSEFLEIVEGNTCWVGPLSESDTRWRINDLAKRHGGGIQEPVLSMIVQLTGGLAAFVKAASEAWLGLDDHDAQRMSSQKLQKLLLRNESVRRTCQEILKDIEPIERETLLIVASDRPQLRLNQDAIEYLKNHGLLRVRNDQLEIFSPLFVAYLHGFYHKMPGFISVDTNRRELLLDGMPLIKELTPMEYNLISYMIKHSNQALSHDDLIDHLWGEAENRQGLKESLQQHIRGLRKKLEPHDLATRIVAEHGYGYYFEQPELSKEYAWLQS